MILTIVTVCLNSEATIDRCITSVMRNCEAHAGEIEYIILDGNSVDQTVSIARQLCAGVPYVRLLSEPDDGIYDAYNKGIRLAQSDYIWFVNSDDELRDNAVDTVLSHIGRQPRDLIHCFSVQRINSENGYSRIHLRSKDSVIRKFSTVCHTPGIIFPVRILKELGLFDTSLQICSDFKLLQMALTSRKFSNHDECVINMYLGGISSDRHFEYRKAVEQIRVISDARQNVLTKIVPIIRIYIKFLRNRFVNPAVSKVRSRINAH